ncbi:Sphingoid long-chain base transporter RSB1 [Tolypocladium ophioglossoides CBS 100239]|uniref:Sphingoid long-chain base transporter RSB1 n=1 Tax=Tolypocladium ophioglossoides (strain CBS 100239) TaxID=1163406 RepID=A0A0L0N718_TOLOC|nr:Sphingoid long-chain base transporter RSB1 [Tolypocladium ophioglossoides CBS 100239]
MSAPDSLNSTSHESLQAFCLRNPDSPACDDVPNFYSYHIDIAANAAFLAIFAASLLGYAVTLAVTRRGVAFNVAVMLGLVCEVLGYAGRIMSWRNPWDENGFLMQICCLTIGPAFMAAGIYLCLRRIVSAFGPENSRIPPEYYTRIFIPCDVISLILQATGGGMAAVAFHGNDSSTMGTHIMVAGLSFQVATIVGFILASLDFALRTYRASPSALASDPALVHMRGTRRFRGFLAALVLSTLCILWRSAFRVAELSEGWSGPIISKQGLLIGFEGVLIVVAVLALNLFHPVICAPELFARGGGLTGVWSFRRKTQDGGEKTPKRNGHNEEIKDSSDSA